MISIIDINIDYLKEKNYTEIGEDSLEKLLYIFICNDKEVLEKIYKGDEIMKKVVEKVNTLTEDFENELYYDKEEIINKYSYDLGKEERNIEIAKNLLRINLSDEDIIKSTNITIEQLEEIKNNIKNENNHE